MSIIEQAARRLEELRRSGIDVPGDVAQGAEFARPGQTEGVPARVARMLEQGKLPPGEGLRVPNRPTLRDVSPVPSPRHAQESRRVEIDLARLAAMGYLTPETPRAQIINATDRSES